MDLEMSHADGIFTRPGPWRLDAGDGAYFEVLFEDLSTRGTGGQTQRVRVFRSSDAGERFEVPLKLTWRGYLQHLFKGVGGDLWPPRGEDIQNASLVDGRLTMRFATIFQPNANDTVTQWEAKYFPERQKWEVKFFGFL